MCINISSPIARMEQDLPVLRDKANSISLLLGKNWGPNPGILRSISIPMPDASCQHTVLNWSLVSSSSETPGLFCWQVEFAVHGSWLALGNSTHWFSHIYPRVSSSKKNLETAVIMAASMHKVFLKEAILWRKSYNTVPPWTGDESVQSWGSTTQRCCLEWMCSRTHLSLCPTAITRLCRSKHSINVRDTREHVLDAGAHAGWVGAEAGADVAQPSTCVLLWHPLLLYLSPYLT